MAISDKDRQGIPSPVEKYIQFSGASGEFTYWDKEAKKEVVIALPMRFVVLDELSCVKGWDEKTKSSIYSNEVRSTKNEELTVRSKAGTIVSGLYSDIKDKLGAIGCKYTKSIYIFMDGEICNLTLKGASLNAWIELDRANSYFVGGTKDGKKGAVKYKTPVFEIAEDDQKEIDKATVVFDMTLKPYLDARSWKEPEDEVATASDFEFEE